jgi:hypothetical protein
MHCWELSRKAGFRFSQEQSKKGVREGVCRVEQCGHFRESKRVTELSDGGEESLAEVPNTEQKENDFEGCCEGKKSIEA